VRVKVSSRRAPQQEIIGEVHYHRQLVSPLLKFPRDVIVWLPPSYRTSRRKRFPVLYAHDGQNLMDPTTSFLGVDWRMDETADRLIRAGRMKEIIVVGIYNTPDRNSEYTGGKPGKDFATFVVQQLKPLIDSTYRTQPDAKNTAVLGSSMGGLISFYFAWWFPQVFAQAACISSSFFWNDYQACNDVLAQVGPKKKIRLYVDVGGKEKFLTVGYKKMVTTLKQKGYKKGLDLDYYVDRNASHNEQCWGDRLWRPLMFLFGMPKLSKSSLL